MSWWLVLQQVTGASLLRAPGLPVLRGPVALSGAAEP